MLPYLKRDKADLVQDARPLNDFFLAIRGEFNQDLLDVLLPTAFIEGHAPKVIRAKQRLAKCEAQDSLGVREEVIKQEMVELKGLMDNLKSASPRIQEKLNQLRTEREQLLMKLKGIDASIQIKEENLAQLPMVTAEKKAKMTTKYNDLKDIRDKKNKAIPRSATEDNRLISEADVICLDALNAV